MWHFGSASGTEAECGKGGGLRAFYVGVPWQCSSSQGECKPVVPVALCVSGSLVGWLEWKRA